MERIRVGSDDSVTLWEKPQVKPEPLLDSLVM